MAHNHENCSYGCSTGLLFGPCGEDCPTDDCVVEGHCPCLCHSGKDCGCGYTWTKMEKQT